MRSTLRAGVVAATLVTPAIASGQTLDPDTRDEITSIRGDLASSDLGQVGYDLKAALTTADGTHKPLSLAFSVNGRHTTNAGATPSNEDAANYILPKVEFGLQPFAPGPVWSWGFIGRAEASRYDEDGSTYNTGKAELEAWAKATLNVIDVLAGYNVQGNYDGDFETRAYTINSYTLSLRSKAKNPDGSTKVLYIQADLGRKASHRANSRRDQGTLVLRYTHPQPIWGAELVAEERIIYSNFRGGTNKGRDDVLFRSAGAMTWPVGDWRLGLNVVAAANASNRDAADSFTFEIGPSFSRRW